MQSKKIKTVWEYSLETEALRLLHCAHQISTGFFGANNFLVLAYQKSRKHEENQVSLVDLPYLSIHRFWEKSARLEVKTLPLQIPDDLFKQTLKLLEQNPLSKPYFKDVEKLWTKYQDKIINEIYKIIPGKKNFIKGITIWPTSFGTNCSFNLLNDKPGQIYIWLRDGSSIASIVEAILSSITRLDVYNNLNGLWQESEIIVDFLLAYSSLGELLRKIDPTGEKPFTIQKTRSKQNGSLLNESEEFLRKIGAPTQANIFSAVNGHVLIRKNPVTNLTPREKEILKLLVSKSPNVVTIDEIGDILFSQNEDAFSLYAIAKLVQRLRDKLESNGISGSFIQTKRGEGYLLVN